MTAPNGYNETDSHAQLELEITNYFMGSACPNVEQHITATPGVHSVSLNRTTGIIEVGYDRAHATPETIIEAVKHCGFMCREGGPVHEAGKALHELGLKVVMLTGDARSTAEAVARSLNIDTVIAEVLPDQKAEKVSELQGSGKRVAMGGDGVNDAPLRAEVAIDTADVVLMRSDPFDIVKALVLSRKVRGKIKQNLFWAAIYNVIAIPIAGGILFSSLGILLRPEWAALAMAASTITVTINALALEWAGLPQASSKMTEA